MKRILLSIVLCFLMCGHALAANKWMNGSTAFLDGDAVLFNDFDTNANNYILEPLNRQLINSLEGMALIYDTAAQITVSTGSVVCTNSGGTLNEIRRNTSNTTVTWSDIDTGAEASSTTYYVYSSCDADATTATFKISTSSTSPSGVTLYRKIGSFYNDSSSNIDRARIYTEPYGASLTNSSGVSMVQAFYDYGTSTSSYTSRAGLLVAMGQASIGGSSSVSLSNLPFSSTSSYEIFLTFETDASTSENPTAVKSSGSAATLYNPNSTGRNTMWMAVGF